MGNFCTRFKLGKGLSIHPFNLLQFHHAPLDQKDQPGWLTLQPGGLRFKITFCSILKTFFAKELIFSTFAFEWQLLLGAFYSLHCNEIVIASEA
jgi:hypothetical protein